MHQVTMSQAIVTKLQRKGGLDESELGDLDIARFRSQMMSLGTMSALSMEDNVQTKKFNLDEQEKRLARELGDFLWNLFSKSELKTAPETSGANIISLSDLYCMFNRARGLGIVFSRYNFISSPTKCAT
jgi:hypothetical protein